MDAATIIDSASRIWGSKRHKTKQTKTPTATISDCPNDNQTSNEHRPLITFTHRHGRCQVNRHHCHHVPTDWSHAEGHHHYRGSVTRLLDAATLNSPARHREKRLQFAILHLWPRWPRFLQVCRLDSKLLCAKPQVTLEQARCCQEMWRCAWSPH